MDIKTTRQRRRLMRKWLKEEPIFFFENCKDLQVTDADLVAVFKMQLKRKKGKAKYYGRKGLVEQKLKEFREGNYDSGIEAIKLYGRRNSYYRVFMKFKDGKIEKMFNPNIGVEAIQRLVAALNKCKSLAEAEQTIISETKYIHIS